MNLSSKCCNALGCRSEIEKELDSLRKVVFVLSGHVDTSFCVDAMSRFFNCKPVDLVSVSVGDYYCDGSRICYVRNQFTAECVNDELGGVETVQVWRNENT